MKTLLRICSAMVIVLFCLSAMNMAVALFVPSMRGSAGLIQSLMYNAEAIVLAPARAITGVPVFLLLAGSILVVAVMLRRAFGGPEHAPRRPGRDETRTPDAADLDDLARDLQHAARRMEERLDALETILLERGQHSR